METKSYRFFDFSEATRMVVRAKRPLEEGDQVLDGPRRRQGPEDIVYQIKVIGVRI